MLTIVSICVGEILDFLDRERGEVPLVSIVKKIHVPHEIILMALGWLARDGYVAIRGVNASYSHLRGENLLDATVSATEKNYQ